MNSFHQAYTTVKYPTSRRIVKMGTMAISFIWFLSTLFGIAAYLSLGQSLKDVALFPDRDPLKGSNDYANKILKSGKLLTFHLTILTLI
jgi:hypothetical protein